MSPFHPLSYLVIGCERAASERKNHIERNRALYSHFFLLYCRNIEQWISFGEMGLVAELLLLIIALELLCYLIGTIIIFLNGKISRRNLHAETSQINRKLVENLICCLKIKIWLRCTFRHYPRLEIPQTHISAFWRRLFYRLSIFI